MKAKHININITRKIDSWLKTIEDQKLRNDARKNVVLTGGAISSMLMGEPVNDFDVYFKTHEVAEAVATYYINQWNKTRKLKYEQYVKDKQENPVKYAGLKERAIPVEVKLRHREVLPDGTHQGLKIVVQSAGIASEDNGHDDYGYFELPTYTGSEQADYLDRAAGISVSDTMETSDSFREIDYPSPSDLEAVYDKAFEISEQLSEADDYRPVFLSGNAISLKGRIQLVFRFIGEPEQIHNNYDFVHCTNYWTSATGLVLKQEALEAILAKELRYVGSLYPICSIFRTQKFLDRGWTITAGTLFKICHQISFLDLTDIKVLEDQTCGVDTAYFTQLIEAMKRNGLDDDGKVKQPYLMELIDRIF